MNFNDTKIGDILLIGGDDGFCTDYENEVVQLSTKYDENTGEKYTVIHTDDDGNFDARTGNPIEPPWAYYIKKNLGDKR